MTTGQRRTLNDVEEVHGEDRNGQRYVVYEHLSQGSPTALENARKEVRRVHPVYHMPRLKKHAPSYLSLAPH